MADQRRLSNQPGQAGEKSKALSRREFIRAGWVISAGLVAGLARDKLLPAAARGEGRRAPATHSDLPHNDAHLDILHVDEHGDEHGDVNTHQDFHDNWHINEPYLDHNEIIYTDLPHLDAHEDIPHEDVYNHMDHSWHCDYWGDNPGTIEHGDNELHCNSEGCSWNDEVAYHCDEGHYNWTDHTDSYSGNPGHSDYCDNSGHDDHDDHADIAHTDWHENDHTDISHEDHSDNPHRDEHGDAHEDTHGDDAFHTDWRFDIPHEDHHGDMLHQDSA